MWRTVQETLAKFLADNCPQMAAALAYYAIFSLPALLLFSVSIAGMFVSRDDVAQTLAAYSQQSLGDVGAKQIQVMLDHVSNPKHRVLGSTLSMGILLFGATGAFVEMQSAFNRIWKVPDKPRAGVWRTFFTKRLFSLAMVLGVACLLLVLLMTTWLLGIFGELVNTVTPDWLSKQLLSVANTIMSLAVITLLFTGIFKYVPDVQLGWRDVIAGAFLTAVLYVLGKSLLGFYLRYADPLSVFGAAGSLALILLWVYYSALIVFLGAEFAQVTAQQHANRR